MKLRVRQGISGDFSYREIPAGANIHIMGVCGTAMSSLAGLLVEQGYFVSGSDQSFYPPASEELKRLGIRILKGYKAENIHSRLDLVVVGNVISKNMPEAQALLRSGLPYLSLPEILNPLVIKKKNSIMVCGTHGKTTISFLSAWVLDQCGLNPGFMIGGVAENFKSGFRLKDSNWFIVEGDEYDTAFFEKTPKFVHYISTHRILTNVEFDHADIYKDIHAVQKAFLLLMEKTEDSGGYLIAGLSSPFIKKLISQTRQKVITYGIGKGDYEIIQRRPLPIINTGKNIKQDSEGGQIVSIKEPDGNIVEIQTPLPGEHNAFNILPVWILGRIMKLNDQKVLSAFKNFKGVRRRFQVLGNWRGITVVEDFAHHPSAVKAVLKSAKEQYPQRRLLAAFEPRSATSRRNIFQNRYKEALSLADIVFCLKPYDQKRILPSDRFHSKKLIQELKTNHTLGFYAESVEEMVHTIQQRALRGDVLLLMSNGNFGGIYSLLETSLKGMKK